MNLVSENITIYALRANSIGKTPPTEAENFLLTLFDLNQTGKIVFTKNYSI